jgi:hypothetical protein
MFARAAGMPTSAADVPDVLAQKAGNAIADIQTADPTAATAKGITAGIVANIPDALRAGMGIAEAPETAEALVKLAKKPVEAVKRAYEAFKAPSLEEVKLQQQMLESSFQPSVDAARTQGTQGVRQAEDILAQERLNAQMGRLQRQQSIQAAVDKARAEGEAAISPVKNQVVDLKTQLNNLPVEQRQAALAAEEARRVAGETMGQAEDAAGFPSDAKLAVKTARRAENPEFVKETLARFGPDFRKGPEAILERGYRPQTIQAVRKLFENEELLKGTASGVGEEVRRNAAKALEMLDPEGFGVARQKYLQTLDDIKNLPVKFAERKASLQNSLLQANQALDLAQESLQNNLKAIQAAQRDAVNASTRSQRLAAIQNTFKARQQVTMAKRELADLVTRAKTADASQLAQIEAQSRALLEQGLKNSAIRTRYVRAGKIAAGAAGLGATYDFLRIMGHHD